MKIIRLFAWPLLFLSSANNVNAEVYANEVALASIRNAGLVVHVHDNVSDGCWTRPSASENKAISLLHSYGLYNADSPLIFSIRSVGHRSGGTCAVSALIEIYFHAEGHSKVTHLFAGYIMSGGDQSDKIRSLVEDAVHELVTAMAKAGI